MSGVAEESIASGERERMREEDVDDDVSDDEEEEEKQTAGEEESRRVSTAASASSLLSTPSSRGTESTRGRGRRDRPVRSHALVELTSLDELSLPTNAARSIKYTCIAASRRLLVLGTSTGSVYVFARFAARQRASAASGGGRLNAVPLHVYTTKDGALHTVRISPNEQLIAVGGESGRVSVLSLAAGVGGGGVGGAATGTAAASSAPGSPASALIHSVPGEARSPDRVNCLCWSCDSSLLYAAHASGMVVQHKVGIRRSVFRSPSDQLFRLKGPAVQMEYAAGPTTTAAAARLLISTPEATFVHDLQAAKAYQVGNKLRNSPMGACWMRGEGGTVTDDFVLAARQNGRIWEASTTGIVYKTHQLRQSACIPTLDALSFRVTADAATPPSFLQQAAIDTETARTTVHLGSLAPITVECAPLPSAPSPADALSLPSTSSATTSFASTASSSISSSTATVAPEPATRLVCSAVRSTLFVADIDRSQLVVVSDLGHVIRDWAVCGSDVFVLFSGSGASSGSGAGLRKYSLFPVERAAERLLGRKAVLQAARLVLSVRPPESTVDAPDTVAAGWPMPLIEKIQTALAAIRKKESESLRRQLNDLVCGGDRKPSIGEEETTVVSESLSSLAVARTRHVSTSDRYLDRRRPEGEEEEGAGSEYEDGEGGVIRRERGRRKRLEERSSRSSPDNLRPLGRPTAASAAKTRAVSPRSDERRVRRDELKRAKRMLESETGHLQTEHRDSLRTLLELGSPPPMQFNHSVTVASVARNLAELARVAPPSITDLLVERRTSAKQSSASSGSKRGGGARVVKHIRPQRPTSGGAGGGSRKSGAGMEEEERNSNVLLVEGTKKFTRSSVVIDETEDSENNVEWRREKRMGGVFLREEGGALTRATAVAPQEHAVDSVAAAAAELQAQRCDRCGLHKSWLAVFLFGAAVHRVSVVVREYGRGGVPCTSDEWADALDTVVDRREEKRAGCGKCEKAMMKAMESVPASGRFCDGLRPAATRVDAEAMKEKVLSLPEEVLRAAVFGVSTERRKGRRSGESRQQREEKENGGVQQLPAAATAVQQTAMGEEVENGNGKEEREEEDGDEKKWTAMMDARQVLTAALFVLGREGLREMVTQRAKRRTLECLSDGDWALLARLLAPRENAATTIPIQMARAMLKEYGMHKFVSIDGPPHPPPAIVPTPSIRGGGGYGRRVPSIDSPKTAREPATVSWPTDTTGVCPMCSLALTATVGGGRRASAAAAATGGEVAAGSMLACYPCGHAYHAVCIGESTRRRPAGSQPGISPVCIVCRVRARRSKAAAAAVTAK